MNFDVKIDCRALFNECVDQTLLDYRNRTTEAGQSMTATHTLELSLLDAFMFNFIPDLLLFRMRDILDMAPEATAIRIKDALKFGMLMWWYGGKDAPLFQYYQILFGNALDDLRSKLIGSHTERPYRML